MKYRDRSYNCVPMYILFQKGYGLQYVQTNFQHEAKYNMIKYINYIYIQLYSYTRETVPLEKRDVKSKESFTHSKYFLCLIIILKYLIYIIVPTYILYNIYAV